jgi:hypothetical protein
MIILERVVSIQTERGRTDLKRKRDDEVQKHKAKVMKIRAKKALDTQIQKIREAKKAIEAGDTSSMPMLLKSQDFKLIEGKKRQAKLKFKDEEDEFGAETLDSDDDKCSKCGAEGFCGCEVEWKDDGDW